MEDDLGGNATSLAFRVNRGEIVLNDANSGTVWDVQQDKPIRIDNWEAFTSKKKNKDDDEENENQTDADRRPPRAKPDSYGVRAGRTTVLHPLDNDSAPDGRLLSIVDVDQPSGGARVEISPDGQTLVLEMPEDGRPARFDYFIDDGRNGLSANAAVDVTVRGTEQNEPPALREGWKKPTYKVPHGGELAVPVLGDWRDDSDGDTLLLESAKAVGGEESGAAARTTADGRIRFTAPSGPADGSQLVRVEFAVTDGRSAPVTKSMGFQVQAPKDQKSYAPQAEPDVVRGEVGKPIKIRPLLNDLPGSDPNATDAELSLGGKVPQQPNAKVVTDLDAGQLTFTGERAGTYFLSYDAAFGNAPLDQGTIRVDVKASPKRAADPIAMPDTLTVYGQAPGIVDVLANDLDPAGGLLVVQRAVGDRADQLDVAIVDGRWLRISATRPDLAPATQTVSYTISNGTSSAVRGEVVVTQRPAPEDNTPITVSDKVVVRAGGSVAAPVLDNDVSPAGDRLTLLNDLSSTDTPGQLAVVAPIDVTGDVGKAFVSGRVVRYVAPEKVEERDTYTVTYVAQNLEGKRADGTLKVTVVPADDPNDAPEPPTLEGRVVSGDTVKVRVPGVGVDRNGDPVTVTGITSAPRLGRIEAVGGNFLEYEAYPRTVGTDEFTYSVVDSQGAFATGTVRVAVVELGQPQPPLAVEDRLTVEPGRTATFDPLANDFIAAGDSVEVEILDGPDGARLDPDTNLVTVPAPDSADAPPTVLVYRVTNGIDESRATMTLTTAEDYDNPPIVYDAFGRADDSGSVVVDVLEGAYDPDGAVEDLEVVDVSGDPSARVVDGVQVRADRGEAPKVLPFQVRDADGATAAASVYIPPTGDGLPYVLPGSLIELDSGESTTGKVTDYIAAPDGGKVRLASGRRSYSASPTSLTVGPDGDNQFTLSAPAGFRGPGSVLVEVTTATDASGNEDATTTEDGVTAILSIPVVVGDDVPSLECPSNVIPMSSGQRYDLDIETYCTVFTVDPRDAADLDFTAEWSQAVDGVDVGSPVGSVVPVTASDDATEGGEAVLTVRAGESNPQEVRFRLAQAPPPRLNPIRVETMEAGQSRTYDMAAYLQAGVANPDPTIVQVQNTGTPGVKASVNGSRLTLTAERDTRGADASFRLVVSDVSDGDPPSSRTAEGRIQFRVIGTPSPPGEPRPYPLSDEVGTIKMGWAPPDDDGGAPLTLLHGARGEVRHQAAVRHQRVRLPQAEDGRQLQLPRAGVQPGGRQRVEQPVAHGAGPTRSRAGSRTSGWPVATTARSPSPGTSRPPTPPGSWTTRSRGPVEAPSSCDGSTTSFPVTGLDNNQQYVFTIKAQNAVGYSLPRTSGPMQPLGTPPAPAAPAVTDLESGANQTNIRIAWQAVLPEGPGPTVYTVSYTNGVTSGTVPGCQRLASLTCTHAGVPYDGLTYTYTVVAANQPGDQPGKRSPAESPAPPSRRSVARRTGARSRSWRRATARRSEVQYTVPGLARLDQQGGDPGRPGQSNRTLHAADRHDHARAIHAPSNEQPYPVQLRVCNEEAPGGLHAERRAERPDLRTPRRHAQRHRSSRVVNGKTMTWTITGTSNGDPAPLGGPAQRRRGARCSSLGGRRRVQLRPRRTPRRTSTQDVTHRRGAARPRRRAAVAGDATTGRRPQRPAARPRSVIVARGAPCNDGDRRSRRTDWAARGAEDTPLRRAPSIVLSRSGIGLYAASTATSNGAADFDSSSGDPAAGESRATATRLPGSTDSVG